MNTCKKCKRPLYYVWRCCITDASTAYCNWCGRVGELQRDDD